MPRLVSSENLAPIRSFESGRPVASADLSGIAKGVEGFGKSIERASGTLATIVERDHREEISLDEATAKSRLLVETTKLDAELRQEQDPAKIDEIKGRYATTLNDAAGLIRDENRRQKFILAHNPDIAKAEVRASDQKFGIQRDGELASHKAGLLELQKAGVEAPDEETRVKIIDAGNSKIAALRSAGYITAQQETAMRREWSEGYGIAQIASIKDPLERISAVAGNRAALRMRESGGNPGTVNQFGHAGLYQFGAPRLQAIGVYSPGSGEDMGGWSKSGRDAPGKWSGTFHIPGFPEVKTLQDFRNNTAAQEKAYEMHDAKMNEEIKANGLDKFIGQNVGGITITQDGIKNMIHLGGVGGARNALESGGTNVSRDANGTSVLDYARMGSFSRGSKVASLLSPEARARVEDVAQREYAAQRRQQEIDTREESQRVSSLMQDDLHSIRSTGKPVNELSIDRIEKSMGKAAAEEHIKARGREAKFYETTRDFDTLPNDAIMAAIEDARPVGGGAGFAEDQKNYEAIEKRGRKTIENRLSDPASAVETVAGVRDARAKIEYVGEGENRRLTPDSAQSIVRARLQAQEALGIERPYAVTKREAAMLGRQLRQVGEDNEQGITQFLSALEKTYGGFAPQVLQSMLELQGVNRELSITATRVLGSLMRSKIPDISSVRQLDADLAWNSMADAWGIDSTPPQVTTPATLDGPLPPESDNNAPSVSPADAVPKNTVPADAVLRMMRDPSMAADVDATYPGASKKINEELTRRRNPNGK